MENSEGEEVGDLVMDVDMESDIDTDTENKERVNKVDMEDEPGSSDADAEEDAVDQDQDNVSTQNQSDMVRKRTPSVKRPRRVMFDNAIHLKVSAETRRILHTPTKFPGMGTHEIVQRMADRGHILYIDGVLKWVGPTGSEDKNDHNRSWAIADSGKDGDDKAPSGGLLCHYSPMTVETIITPKWRYRKKNRVKTAEEKMAAELLAPKLEGRRALRVYNFKKSNQVGVGKGKKVLGIKTKVKTRKNKKGRKPVS